MPALASNSALHTSSIYILFRPGEHVLFDQQSQPMIGVQHCSSSTPAEFYDRRHSGSACLDSASLVYPIQLHHMLKVMLRRADLIHELIPLPQHPVASS